MKVKNNIISEIARIHQIMGVNKQISEQVIASTPAVLFKKLIDDLAQYATRKSLDRNNKSLISQLSRGTKQITDAAGKIKNTPFDDDDYLNIFGKLRSSPDQGIRNIISAADTLISDFIVKQSLPRILDSPAVVGKIQQDIQNGYSEDYVVDLMAKVIKDKYGVYANDVIDEFLDGVRKVYKDLGGKVDDVVDDTGKVVDDTADDAGKVVDDTTNAADDTAKTADEKTEEILPKLPQLEGEESISKELSELSPVFTRYRNDVLTKLEKLSNELQELIESRTAPGGDSTQVDEIDKQIKNAFEGIWNINRDYVKKLESQIKYNLQFTDDPNYSKWLKIRDYIQYIKTEYGDWGAWKVSTPKSEGWIFINSTLEAAFRTELKMVKEGFVKTIREWWSSTDPKVQELEKQAQTFSRQINTDLKSKAIWQEKIIFPGSSRGLPKKLEMDDKGLYYPNAHGEILKYSTKYPKVKAWLSLLLEKLIIVGKVQILYSVVMTLKDFWKFFWTENEVQRKYRSCIKATSLAMKEGKMKKGEEFDVNSVPPCLMKLMKSTEFVETELEDFLIRADFFSRGSNTEILSKTFNKYLLEMGFLDPIRLFTGVQGQILIKFFNEWLPKIIEIEDEGDAYAFEENLINALETLEAESDTIVTQIDTLGQNMNDKEIEEANRILDSLQTILNTSSGIEIVPIPSRNQ